MPVKISTLAEVEKAHILDVIEYFEGNVNKSAKALGMGKSTLYRKLKEWGSEISHDENKE